MGESLGGMEVPAQGERMEQEKPSRRLITAALVAALGGIAGYGAGEIESGGQFLDESEAHRVTKLKMRLAKEASNAEAIRSARAIEPELLSLSRRDEEIDKNFKSTLGIYNSNAHFVARDFGTSIEAAPWLVDLKGKEKWAQSFLQKAEENGVFESSEQAEKIRAFLDKLSKEEEQGIVLAFKQKQ